MWGYVFNDLSEVILLQVHQGSLNLSGGLSAPWKDTSLRLKFKNPMEYIFLKTHKACWWLPFFSVYSMFIGGCSVRSASCRLHFRWGVCQLSVTPVTCRHAPPVCFSLSALLPSCYHAISHQPSLLLSIRVSRTLLKVLKSDYSFPWWSLQLCVCLCVSVL